MASPTTLALQGATNGVVNGTNNWGISQSTANDVNQTATLNLIASLVFAESKSVRTSTIILAAFNVLAAFTTASSILYDCYWASKRCNPKFKASKFCVSKIHPAETFPLLLAIGIVIQGLVFAAVQGTGLQSLFVNGCALIAQFMWPALFILPYLQVVFGLECAIRSLRKLPFQARGKYDVTICSTVVILMLTGTWVPSHITPQPDHCFASLVWYISSFGFWGLILTTSCAGLMLISALTIFFRLSTVNSIDQHQRIAASRMVYYLVVGIVSLAFVIPDFVSQTFRHGDLKLAMMATVVLNLSGLMSGLLHMILRSNTATTSFGTKHSRSWDRAKHEIKIFGPNELAFQVHFADPVSEPRYPMGLESPTSSLSNLMDMEKGRGYSMESIRSPPPVRSPTRYNPLTSNAVTQIRALPNIREPAISPKRTHTRKQSYSLFPAGNFPDEASSPIERTIGTGRQQEPASIYDISELQPPPMLFGEGKRGHRRDSSVASSATVQIGLRLSHAPIPSEDDVRALPLPATTYNGNLGLPSTTYNAHSTQKAASPIRSPLKVKTEGVTPQSLIPIPIKSPKRPSPLNTNIWSPTKTDLIRATTVNKTLPPTPKAPGFVPMPIFQRLNGSTTQLSPTVYSPGKSVPKPLVSSPLTVPQSATIPAKSPFNDSLIAPKRSKSDRQIAAGASKGEWI